MATVPVKYFHSGMAGAPVLSGTAGALIAILDACLKDGFGLKTVDSLVVASNVATMTISTGHSFEVGSVALVAGATPSSLNGEWRVTAITTSTVKFATSGISDQTATGTITTKLAPVGFTKFAGSTSTLSAYKSSDPTSLGHWLRVDDAGTTDARVVGYESMSDINTGVGPYPTSAQLSGGGYWVKSTTANSTARNWALLADGAFFYFWCVPGDATSVTSQGNFAFFGDMVPISSADTFCSIIGCRNSATSGSAQPAAPFYNNGQYTEMLVYASKSFTGLGNSIRLSHYSEMSMFGPSSPSGFFSSLNYPNGPDNSLFLARTALVESSHIRGYMPGGYYINQNVQWAFNSRDTIVGANDFSGKTLMTLRFGYFGNGQNGTGGVYGVAAFDQTGPWR